jgi:hemerythrin-like domain-containing protein
MMLMEHKTKREYVKNLKKALDENNEEEMKKNGLAIVSLLGEHIFKEDNILYPMAEDVLSEDDMSGLSHKCKEMGETR